MRQLDGKIAVVIGGSRGFGQGIVRALAAEGAVVWALARNAGRLAQLKQAVAGVQTLLADVTEAQTAPQTLRATRPDILVLNAGATPSMAPVHQQSWEQFARTWQTDVYMTFAFGKEALLLPLAPGSVVVIVSSGAAIGGSPLSGGYAGAKRTQWFLAQYLQHDQRTSVPGAFRSAAHARARRPRRRRFAHAAGLSQRNRVRHQQSGAGIVGWGFSGYSIRCRHI